MNRRATTLTTLCRMSGIWGYQTALDLYLQEHGITTLLFAGVNADQVRLPSWFREKYRPDVCCSVY